MNELAFIKVFFFVIAFALLVFMALLVSKEIKKSNIIKSIKPSDELSITIHSKNPFEDDVVILGTVTAVKGDYVQFEKSNGSRRSVNLRTMLFDEEYYHVVINHKKGE